MHHLGADFKSLVPAIKTVATKMRRMFSLKIVTRQKCKYFFSMFFALLKTFQPSFGHLVPDNLTHHIRCWIVPWRHLRIEARRVDAARIRRDEFQVGEVKSVTQERQTSHPDAQRDAEIKSAR